MRVKIISKQTVQVLSSKEIELRILSRDLTLLSLSNWRGKSEGQGEVFANQFVTVLSQFFSNLRTFILPVFGFFAVFFSIGTTLFGQNRLDVPGLALGKSTVAFGRGIDALTINPANVLPSSTTPTLSISAAPMAMMAGSSIVNLKDLKFYFGGDGTKDANGNPNPRFLTNTERDQLLGMIDQGRIASQVETMPICAVLHIPELGAFSFAVISSFQMQVRFPTNFQKLLNGYAGKEAISLTEGLYSAILYSSYQVSYATSIKAQDSNRPFLGRLRVGGSLKYIRGLAFHDVNQTNRVDIIPYIPAGWDSTINWSVKTQYNARSAGFDPTIFTAQDLVGFGGKSAGNGIGLDIGFWGNLSTADSAGRQAGIAFSVSDVGGIFWDKNATSYSANLRDTVKGVAQISTEELNRYKGSPDSSAFSAPIPTKFRLGIVLPVAVLGWDFPLTTMAEITQGLNNIGANTTIPRVGMGVQLGDNALVLRFGMQAGGIEGLGFSGGLAYLSDTFSCDISAGSLAAVIRYSTAHWFDYAFRIRLGLAL